MPFYKDRRFGVLFRIIECFAGAIVAFPSIAVWHEPFYAKVLFGTLIIVIAIF